VLLTDIVTHDIKEQDQKIPSNILNCFRKVLVTEWIVGEKLASSSKETINRLVPVGIECFLTQLLETGYFHADPHPGNLMVPTVALT
jgi:aarF domain-containing kinase